MLHESDPGKQSLLEQRAKQLSQLPGKKRKEYEKARALGVVAASFVGLYCWLLSRPTLEHAGGPSGQREIR